jgi:hypothetical protein
MADPRNFPRCQVVPLPGEQVSLRVDGAERVRWHYGTSAPRPFFYPFLGPSGESLTRMGHPGAPDHDHHRSVWFAHNKVVGVDFWSDRSPARIRQSDWLVYQDGEEEAVMAVQLQWLDGHDPKPLLEQELVAALWPGEQGETFLELQSTFRPTAASLEFGQTNFGFLAVRVAKNISEYFGGGRLTSGTGLVGEPAIFGKQAPWMDYSGPVRSGETEGITYFDHPSNPRYPTHWHVREDGWTGAAACLAQPLETSRMQPLMLRYLLHAHAGALDPEAAARTADHFAGLGPWVVEPAGVKHTRNRARRTKAAP